MKIKEIFEYIVPLMMVVWCLSVIAGRRFNLGVVILAVLMALFPFQGLSLSDLILSLNPVFSMGSAALMFHLLWKRFVGRVLLSEKDLIYFAVWNVLLSFCLYASSLGFVDIDLYPLGYRFSVLFVLTAVMTMALFLFRSPLAYIFLLYIAAYDMRLLASENFFDYMTDTVLFIVSIIILIRAMIAGCRKKTVGCDTGCCKAEG